MKTIEKSDEVPVLKTVATLFWYMLVIFAVIVGLLVPMAPRAHAEMPEGYRLDAAGEEIAKALGDSIVNDDMLKYFGKFVVYTSMCDIEATVISPTTWAAMKKIVVLRPNRKEIADKAMAEVKEEIAISGLPRWCALMGGDTTTAIKNLNVQMDRAFAGHVH
jgi:hypothetical protein